MPAELKTTCLNLKEWNQGNEQGLEGLIERHLGWIQNHVRNRLGSYLRNKAETNDYVQDAMIEFLRFGPRIQINDDQHFRALMVRIVENTIRGKHDWFRAQRRRITREKPLPSDTILSLDPPRQEVERPSQAAHQNEREAWIRLGIELLDPEDSEIVVLHQWEGASFDEVGERLGISRDAARMRYARSLTRLSKLVADIRKGNLNPSL
ncbi:MAG: RNA polymerase sigma factor [Planctomycetota bacterium]